jgi:hypothetical protein
MGGVCRIACSEAGATPAADDRSEGRLWRRRPTKAGVAPDLCATPRAATTARPGSSNIKALPCLKGEPRDELRGDDLHGHVHPVGPSGVFKGDYGLHGCSHQIAITDTWGNGVLGPAQG